MERCSGVIMAISSLPSDYGIGSLGKEAYAFIDFLKAAGQKYWQLLPIGPTTDGDSPYMSPSTFAGNPYFIDLNMLKDDGLVSTDDLNGIDYGDDPEQVDYLKVFDSHYKILRIAFNNGRDKYREETNAFYQKNERWLKNYALFMAVKNDNEMKCWFEWPDAIRKREPQAVAEYSERLKDEIDYWIFIQYLFFKQWDALREYAKKNEIDFIGDIPIYVAMDSADVWSEPEFFQLDQNLMPKEVSGCPPDIFNDDGQRWGNPLYDYDKMKADGFGWWIRRIEGATRLYDVIRIDHFRGFESYWATPYSEDTAKNGVWKKGPGMDLVGVLTSWFHDTKFIAEDLGIITPAVAELLKDSGLPGMKVLEFALEADGNSSYLPHNCSFDSIYYVGTHDNDTALGWVEHAPEKDVEFAREYMHITEDEGWSYGMIRTGMATPCNLFVMLMQDILELPGRCRMNTPGTPTGNWRWRMKKNAITKETIERIAGMTKTYRR